MLSIAMKNSDILAAFSGSERAFIVCVPKIIYYIIFKQKSLHKYYFF